MPVVQGDEVEGGRLTFPFPHSRKTAPTPHLPSLPPQALTVKFASHQLAPGSSCDASLPAAKDAVSAGNAAAGADDDMKGQGLRAAAVEAKAGQLAGRLRVAAWLGSGCRS